MRRGTVLVPVQTCIVHMLNVLAAQYHHIDDIAVVAIGKRTFLFKINLVYLESSCFSKTLRIIRYGPYPKT